MSVYDVPITARLDDSEEVLEKNLEKTSRNIRVACPGIITEFDAEKQTVSVQLSIQERISFHGKPFEDITIPELQDVPIYMPRAGNFVLTMPVTIGDECLVVFADMCIDSWYQSGGTSNVQMDNRRHDLSDGFALLGVWSQPRVISNYSTDSAVLRNLNNDSYVEVKDSDINIITPTKVTITAGSEVEVNAPTVDVNATTVTVDATDVTVTSPTVSVTGGTITLTGTSGVGLVGSSLSTIDGKNFLNHTHTGVQTGLGNTGGVTP